MELTGIGTGMELLKLYRVRELTVNLQPAALTSTNIGLPRELWSVKHHIISIDLRLLF